MPKHSRRARLALAAAFFVLPGYVLPNRVPGLRLFGPRPALAPNDCCGGSALASAHSRRSSTAARTFRGAMIGCAMPRWLDTLKRWAQTLRRDAITLYLAARDPRVPWYAKALAGIVAAYALSPIDLIPDFIPIVGYLDELILLPLAIAGVLRLIDPAVLAERRARATVIAERPVSKIAAALIMALWLLTFALMVWGIGNALQPRAVDVRLSATSPRPAPV